MKKIKNIIFYVSEVLTHRLHSPTWFNDLLAEEYGIPPSRIQAFFDEFVQAGNKMDGLSLEEFWNIKTTNMGSIPLSAIELSAKRYESDVMIDSKMIELVKKIQPKYRLFAFTNTWRPGQAFKTDLEGYFEAFVQSCDINLRKPDPAVFQYMSDTYTLVPEETLFIDNRIENVESARAFGMHAIHFINVENLLHELQKMAIL